MSLRTGRIVLLVLLSPFILCFDYYKTSDGLPVKWFKRNIPVIYYINEKGSDDIADFPSLESAVRSSFNTWAIDGTILRFYYAGITSILPVTESSQPSRNVVGWIESGWETTYKNDKDAIGVTTVIYYDNTGEIIQADMQLNGEYFKWTLSPPSSCPPYSNLVDVRNIVTHEAGHFIGLDHSSDPSATMYNSSPPCETSKRDLAQDDIYGVLFLYGEGSTPFISEIYPTSAYNSSKDFTLKIYGGNFFSPVQVYLDGGERISATSAFLIKSDEIEAHFDLSGKKSGIYTVVVVCNNIPAYLENAFEIKQLENYSESGGCGCESGTPSSDLFFEIVAVIFFLKYLKHVSGKRENLEREKGR